MRRLRLAGAGALAIVLSGCATTGEDGDAVGVNGSGNFTVMGDLVIVKQLGGPCSSKTGASSQADAGAGAGGEVNVPAQAGAVQGSTTSSFFGSLATDDDCTWSVGVPGAEQRPDFEAPPPAGVDPTPERQ